MKIPTVPHDQSMRWVPNPPYYIRFKGIWDMQELYEGMVDWFRKRKYRFHEKVYKHKHPSPFGVERQYIWIAEREEEDYVRTTYEIYFHTYDAHDVDIAMPEGTKKVFTKGRIWMEIRNYTVFDWEGRFNKNAFYAHLKSFYNKFIIRKRFTQGWAPRIRYEAYALHNFVKKTLKATNDEFEHKAGGGFPKKFP